MTNNSDLDTAESARHSSEELSVEDLPESVDLLLEKLEFQPNTELETARQAIVAGLIYPETDPLVMRSAWEEYSDLLQHVTDLSRDRSKSEIAAIIHKAFIFRDADMMLRYIKELDMAETNYSFREPVDEVRRALTAEICVVAETLYMSPEVLFYKLKGVISCGNREHLRDMIDEGTDFNDILSNVSEMILEEGADPDEILAELGVLK